MAETVLVSRQPIQKVHRLVARAHGAAGGAVAEDGVHGECVRRASMFPRMSCFINPLLPNSHR